MESTTSRAPQPVGLDPHARRVGNLLFLSGIGPREPGTNAIPGNEYDAAGQLVRYDIAAQCHSVFRNVRAVLEDAGSSWDKIVDVYADYFKDNRPCRTTVEIKSLPTPIAIELKVIATIDG
jgi:2-aminomuconate deaminase